MLTFPSLLRHFLPYLKVMREVSLVSLWEGLLIEIVLNIVCGFWYIFISEDDFPSPGDLSSP